MHLKLLLALLVEELLVEAKSFFLGIQPLRRSVAGALSRKSLTPAQHLAMPLASLKFWLANDARLRRRMNILRPKRPVQMNPSKICSYLNAL
jgi:hypothetical protein